MLCPCELKTGISLCLLFSSVCLPFTCCLCLQLYAGTVGAGLGPTDPMREIIVLAACAAHEVLPQVSLCLRDVGAFLPFVCLYRALVQHSVLVHVLPWRMPLYIAHCCRETLGRC